MATTAFLQKAYLAYFGRPVDFTGTTAFANSTELQVQNAFSASAESQALYGSTFGAAQINAIYLVLFGRAAEPAGLAYWSNQVQLGLLTPAGAAVGILNGALNADAIAVTNKLDASAKFTIGLDTTAKILGYSGNVAAASARDFLATVTATPVTPAQVDSGVSVAVVAGTANTNAGTTFTLTTGADNFIGGSNGDTFNGIIDATVSTASATTGDTLNGGAGVDTLNLIATTAATSGLLTLNSVENVNIRALAATTVDNLLFTGTTKVASANSVAAVTLNNAALATTYSLENTLSGSQADLTVNFRGADVAGAADVAALNISNVGSSVLAAGAVAGTAPVVTSPAITLGAGVEAITLATAGTNFAAVNSTTATKLVTLTGAGTNNITFGTLNATSTIDASATTGTNVLNVGAGLTSNDVVKGGTGIDTLTATLSGANTGVVLTGIENFTANATSTGVTLLTADAALTGLINNSAAALTIGGGASLKTVALNGTGVAGTQTNTLVLTTALPGAADTVALTIGNRGVAIGANTQTESFTASGIETLSVTTADAALNNVLNLTIADTGLQNLSITSLNAVTLTGLVNGTVGGTLSLIDTSASTGNFTLDLTASATNSNMFATGAVVKLGGTLLSTNTVTFGAEAATDIITVTGSAAADTIVTGTGGTYIVTLGGATDTTANSFTGANATAVNVTGSGGADTIVGSANADTIIGGNGANTITGGGGNDIINLTQTIAATDTLIFGATAAVNGVDTIVGFKAGALASGGDVLNVSAFAGSASGLQTFTANPGVATDLVANGAITLVDIAGGQDIMTAAGLTAALSVGGEFANLDNTTTAAEKYVFVTAASATSTSFNVYYAEFASGGANPTTVTLVGTVASDAAIGALVAANFA